MSREECVVSLEMEPFETPVDLSTAALLIIDMQRDFLEPGGFAEALGNDVAKVQRAIDPCQQVLEAARAAGLFVMHTREGHRRCLSDLHRLKRHHPGCDTSKPIGEPGPMGRIFVRGEQGHDIISRLYPADGEPVIDKPGKGSFYATDLECILHAKGIRTLFICGVTTEVCVHTTVREANDRGFHCVVIGDGCASYKDAFHEAALQMVSAQGGIFGSVTNSANVIKALHSVKIMKD